MDMKLPFFRTQYLPWIIVLGSTVIAVLAYLQTLHYPFISDDELYLFENTRLAKLHLTELWRLFTEPYNYFSEFLPLRELSYWFDIQLFGLNPAEFRLHNIILYLLSLPLVYATTLELWRYFRPGDTSAPWAAATATALFALHPALVESVVWVSGRKYVLPNLFAMLALWLAIRAKREYGLSVWYAAGTLLAFVAMMLSKTSYVTVAPIIALLWWMFRRDMPMQYRHRSQLLWPITLLFLAGILVRIFIASSEDREAFYFGSEAVTRTLAVLGWLVRLAVTPESRHFFYPVFEDPYLPVMVILGIGALVMAVLGFLMAIRKHSLEGFLAAAFLLLCLPYMQLIPYAPPSLVSDRFLSLAAWPAVLLIVALAWRLNSLPRAILLLVIALSWGYQTIERPRDWRNFEALMDADLRAYPGFYMPAASKIVATQLANGLIQEASGTANNISDPEFRDIMNRMINVYYVVHVETMNTGDPQPAMALLKKLFIELKQKPRQAQWNSPIHRLWEKRRVVLANEWRFLAASFPGDALVQYNVGLWMMDEGRYKNATLYLNAAIESQQLPDSMRGTAYKSLGVALLNSGQPIQAEAPLRAALEQSPPELSAYCPLAKVYKLSNRLEEAARAETNCPGGADSKIPL